MYYHLTFRFPLVEVYGIARRINELLHIKRTRMLSINQNRGTYMGLGIKSSHINNGVVNGTVNTRPSGVQGFISRFCGSSNVYDLNLFCLFVCTAVVVSGSLIYICVYC